jgi:hypothetical protein
MKGDFRQVLLVVSRGSHANIIFASIKNSYLWESIGVFHLLENVRASDVVVQPNFGNRIFAN